MKRPVRFRFWLGASYAMIVIQYFLSIFCIQKFSAVKTVPQKVFLWSDICANHIASTFPINSKFSPPTMFDRDDPTSAAKVWLLPPTKSKKTFCPVFSMLSGKFGNLRQTRWKPAKPWKYSILSVDAWKLRQLAQLLLTSIKITEAGRKHKFMCLRPAPCPYRLLPLWHIVYLWGETVETSGFFALISFLVQLDGCGRGIWTPDLRVMSPTSYRTALSRDVDFLLLKAGR